MTTNLHTRTVSGLSWSLTAQAARQILQFSMGVVLARLLSPKDFGLIAMILVFTGFAQVFSDLGLGAALIHKLDLKQRHLNAVFWVNVVAGLILTGTVTAAAPLIAAFYGQPILRSLTSIIALNFILGSFKIVPNALFHKKINFRRLAKIELTAILIGGLVSITMAFNNFGVWSLVAQSLVITTVSTGLVWFLSPWRPSLSFDKNAIKELLKYSSNMLGFNIVNYWARNLDNLFIGRFIGDVSLGIYSRAYTLMMLPISQLSGIVSKVMFPALSIIQHDTERIKSIFLRSTRAIALITFPTMIWFFVAAEPFILTVYGSKWHDVTPVLKILCFVGLVQSVGTTFGWIYTSLGRTDIMFKWGLFAGAVRTVAFIIGLKWGVIGVAAAYALSSYIILWYPAWTIPGRLIKLPFIEMLKNLSGVFVCAMAMGLLVWCADLVLLKSLPIAVRLVIQIVLGVGSYLTIVHLSNLSSYKEIRSIITEFRGSANSSDPGS